MHGLRHYSSGPERSHGTPDSPPQIGINESFRIAALLPALIFRARKWGEEGRRRRGREVKRYRQTDTKRRRQRQHK